MRAPRAAIRVPNWFACLTSLQPCAPARVPGAQAIQAAEFQNVKPEKNHSGHVCHLFDVRHELCGEVFVQPIASQGRRTRISFSRFLIPREIYVDMIQHT